MPGGSQGWLPNRERRTAELRALAGEVDQHLIHAELNPHTSLLVKQVLRTVSAGTLRFPEIQIGTSVIPEKFLITLTTKSLS